MSRYATIIGTGMYVPENEISNATFAEWMNTVSPKLAEVVGKFEAARHYPAVSIPLTIGRLRTWQSKPANRRLPTGITPSKWI